MIGEHLLPERVAEWKAAHPDSHLRMRVSNTDDVIDAVARHEADIGFPGQRTPPRQQAVVSVQSEWTPCA